MSTELEREIRAAFADVVPREADPTLATSIRVGLKAPAPPHSRPWPVLGRWVALAVVVALVAILIPQIGRLRDSGPSGIVGASSSASPSASATTARPSATPSTGLVAYPVSDCLENVVLRCTTALWLAAADGRDAHVIQGTSVVGWSADGSRLVLENTNAVGGAVSLLLADPTGVVLATIEVPCTYPSTDAKGIVGGHLCPDQGEFALSPDGTRVAFTRTDPNVDNSSVVSVLDLATGQSTMLTATRTTNPRRTSCAIRAPRPARCQGFDGSPRWSPDGRSIAFERQLMAPEPGASWDSAALFVVHADGSDLRRVTPSSVHAIGPAWSPDGTRLAFNGSDMVVNAAGTSVLNIKDDIYTIGVDGTGLARLTDDGVSSLPDWTSGGRLAFIRDADSSKSENWIMDADGGNQSRLGSSLAELTAAGCTTCVYVAHEPVSGPLPRAYWQPLP